MNLLSRLLLIGLVASLSLTSMAKSAPYFSDDVYASVPKKFTKLLERDFMDLKLMPRRTTREVVLAKVIRRGFSEEKLAEYLTKYAAGTNKSIESLKEKHINGKVTKHNLTPLHIAAALNDAKAIDWLVAHGANTNIQDAHGWTALHFAALHKHDDLFHHLLDLRANPFLQNIFMGTAYDILNLAHPLDSERVDVRIWSDEKNDVVSISGEDFKKETGADFTHKVVAKPEVLLTHWAKGRVEISLAKFMPKTQSKFQFTDPSHLYENPKLYLKKIDDRLGFGVFSESDFLPGDTLSPYQGEQHLSRPADTSSEFLMADTLDGEHIRGYGSMALDGFPNAAFINVENDDGLPRKVILVATRPISKHDPIIVDYTTHDIKLSRHLELNQQGLEAFEGTLTKEEIEAHKVITLENLDHISTNPHSQGMLYILNTPTAWMHLLLSSTDGFKNANRLLKTDLCKLASPNCQRFKQNFGLATKTLKETTKNSRDIMRKFLSEKIEEGYVQPIFLLFHHLQNPRFKSIKDPTKDSLLRYLNGLWDQIMSDYCSGPKTVLTDAVCADSAVI